MKAEKRCISCGMTKAAEHFYRHAYKKRDGSLGTRFESACKECKAKAIERRIESNRERYAEMRKKSRERRAEHRRAYNDAYYKSHKAERGKKSAHYHLMATYGLSLERFQQLVEEQGGACAVCRCRPVGNAGVATLHVDHDHATGLIRALLCHNCNLALGLVNDSSERLRALAEYIETHRRSCAA